MFNAWHRRGCNNLRLELMSEVDKVLDGAPRTVDIVALTFHHHKDLNCNKLKRMVRLINIYFYTQYRFGLCNADESLIKNSNRISDEYKTLIDLGINSNTKMRDTILHYIRMQAKLSAILVYPEIIIDDIKEIGFFIKYVPLDKYDLITMNNKIKKLGEKLLILTNDKDSFIHKSGFIPTHV